jgi:arabinogalactan endo-1,4-beta-galactosidase
MTFEDREQSFKTEIFAIKEFKNIAQDFFEYWSEPNKSRSKMKWEMEKTWDLTRRLRRWANNNFGTFKKEEFVQKPIIFNRTIQAPVPKKEISEPDMWEWIKEEKLKTNLDFRYIPFLFYPFLESKKLITLTKQNKLDALTERRKQISAEISAKSLSLEYSSKFEQMVKERKLSVQELENLNTLAKRFALLEYLKK